MSAPTLTEISPGTESPSPAVDTLKRDRRLVLVGLTAVTLPAWGYMFFDAWRMHQLGACCRALISPNPSAWPIGDLLLMFAMWSIMMVAMMVPSAAPMVLLFASINRKRRQEEHPYVPTVIFLLGYLTVWTGFSAVATLAQWGLHSLALLSPMMVSTSPVFGGTLLIAAGIFQFTPLKQTCLIHCRTPLHFLMAKWREGHAGAWKMGLDHGLSCTGCCWLLMVLLFVAGVMNLMWVAAISLYVLLEKVAPAARWISYSGGILSISWGLWLLMAHSR